MTTAQPRVLIVLDGEGTSEVPNLELSLALVEVYMAIRRIGGEAIFACDGGGFPLVAEHMRRLSANAAIASFLSDQMARNDLAEALSLQQIVVEDFTAVVFYLLRPDNCGAASQLRADFLERGRIVIVSEEERGANSDDSTEIVRFSLGDISWLPLVLE